MRNAEYYKAKIAELKPLIELGDAKEEELRLLKHYNQELADIEFRTSTLPGPVKSDMPTDEFKSVSEGKQAGYKAKRDTWRFLNPPQHYDPKGE